MTHWQSKIRVLASGAVSLIIILGTVSTVAASHRPPTQGLRGDIETLVCKTSRSGKVKCRPDGIAATIIVRDAQTMNEVTRFTSDARGNYEVDLPVGNYRFSALSGSGEVSPSALPVLSGKRMRIDFFVKTDTVIQF